MKVKALQNFAAYEGQQSFVANVGDILEMPAGADWVKAGLAEPLKGEKPEKVDPETAAMKPPEDAVVPKGKVRDGVMSSEMLKPKKG